MQAVIAEHLDRQFIDMLAQRRGDELDQRGLRPRRAALRQLAKDAQLGHFERFGFEFELGEPPRDAGIMPQRAVGPERLCHGQTLEPVKLGEQARGRAASAAFDFQQELGDGPALAFLADAIGQ